MRKGIIILIVALFTTFTLTACGENEAVDELKMLEVQFDIPESLDVGETLQLEAVVTYGEEVVTDADEVVFEVWERGDQDNSIMIDSENNEDGTYTAETSFDDDGIYEMYAHTTARAMHTMPKREVVVGEGGDYSGLDDENHSHTGGFQIHFIAPEGVQAKVETELMVELLMIEKAFTDANVRFEIWTDDNSDERDWVETEELTDGEYIGTYSFAEACLYQVKIHVEDDNDLNEYEEYEIEVTN